LERLQSAVYGFNKPDAKVSEGLRDSFLLQGMTMSIKGAYDCIKAFSGTDFTEDLNRLDVPTLIMHGDADQIVPFADSAELTAKIVNGAKLKVYPGAPHGLCQTMPDTINADLLAFIRS
jgi:non-heme chloroperoxidase